VQAAEASGWLALEHRTMNASTSEIEQCQKDLETADAEIASLTAKLKAAKTTRENYNKRLVRLKRSADKAGKDNAMRETILGALHVNGRLTTRGAVALFNGCYQLRVQSVLQGMVDAGDIVGLPGNKNSIQYSLLERCTFVFIQSAARKLGLSGMEELVQETQRVVQSLLAGGRGLHHVDEWRIIVAIVKMEMLGLLRVKIGADGIAEGFFLPAV